MKKIGLLFLVSLAICGCAKEEDKVLEDNNNETKETIVTCVGPYRYNKIDYPKIIDMNAVSYNHYDENGKILKSTGGYTIELDSSVSDTEIEDYKEKLKEFCPESNDYCNITSNGKTITLDAKYSDEFLKDETFKKSPEDFKNFMETVNENVTCTISK